MRLGIALAICWTASAAAQTDGQIKDEKVWSLNGLRAGYCVRFLMSPSRADKELKSGFRLLRADQDSTLHPALRHVLEAQPEFGTWTPSSLCFYYTDAVTLGSRRIAENNARKAQMLGAWTLGAVEQGSGKRRDLVVDLFASRERLRNAASTNLVLLHEAEAAYRAATDTSGEQYSQKIGKTELVWSGRTTGDSTLLDQPIVEAWKLAGVRGVTWSAQLSLAPRSSRALVGSLRVEGKGDLADALRSSPIRFVGPFYHGGQAQLHFTR